MKITRGPVPSAQRVTIYGPEGIGKTTLASKFPNPLFIDTEDSSLHLDVARLERPSSWAMLLQQIDYVRNNPTVCDTLVIDTIDWAERLAEQAVLAKHNVKGIEDIGYGRGYVYMTDEMGRLLNRLDDLIEAGIHIVLTAHAQVRKFEQPGEAGAYDRWELKLLKRTAPMVREWCQLVLFANYKTFVVNVDDKGAQKGRNIGTGGKRVIYTSHNPAWDAKNRHGLPIEIDMDYAAIAHCILPREKLAAVKPAASAPAPETQPETPKVQPEMPKTQPTPAPEPAPAAPPAATDLESQGVPRALADLMRANDVSVEDIQQAVADRGYFPIDTPIANYPSDFIEGVLIGAWDGVYQAIAAAKAPF